MVRLFKLLALLAIIGLIAVIGYAYLGDLQPDRVEVNKPVQLVPGGDGS